MKGTELVINRDEWERLREFKKAPFKKRYTEIIESGFVMPELSKS